jgi:hypothetical protein
MALATVRPAVRAFIVVLVWAVFALSYFQHWPLPEAGAVAASVVLFILVLLSANGYGDALARRALPADASTLELVTFSVSTGFGIFAMLMIFLGTVGGWRPSGAIFVLVGGLLLQAYALKRHFIWRLDLEAPPLVPGALILLGAGLSLILAFAPITYYDSLVYHLAMPSAYLQAHKWVPMSTLIYSAFPQNLEMLWTFGLLINGDNLVNLIGWALAAACVTAVLGFGRRFMDSESAWRGAALLAAMPAFLLLTSGGYVDVGLTLFSFLSFYAVLLWRTGRNHWTLILAGVFAGWAVGVKYTGGIPAVIGFLFVLAAERPFKPKAAIIHSLLYGGSALLVFLPWMIKNSIFVGNPVFPFLHEWGIAARNPWVGEAAQGYFRALVEYQPAAPFQLFTVLWNVAAKGLDFGRGMDVLGDFGWAALIALLPALTLARRAPVVRSLLWYSVLFFVPWAMSRPVLRFMMPLAPIFALMAGVVWRDMSRFRPRWIRGTGKTLVCALLLSGFYLFGYVTQFLGLFKVPFGVQPRQAYLLQKLDYYAAASYINREPSAVLTLVVGDQRGYYYNKPVVITPVFNRNPLVDWAEAAPSAEALRQTLKAKGITHLLINQKEMTRLAPYNLFPFSVTAEERWNVLRTKLATRVYADPACEVLAL